jgi:hypothetical protein
VTGPFRRAAARGFVPLGYLLLAIGASWPLARDFATYTAGEVHYDERHAIWVLWHTLQALTGQATWPHTTQLFWPHGVSVLLDGVGPVNGLLALPFWPWGPAAAYNGAALLGLTLSGWCLYALGRDIGLGRGPAFVAGALYLLWPIHLIALLGHLEKLFLGLLPLTLLAGRRAFDPARSRAWLLAPGMALLATLLQNGNQFIFAALALGVLAVQIWWAAVPADRGPRARRILAAGALSLAICAPLLIAIVRVVRDPALEIVLGGVATYYSPDVLSLALPGPHQWWARWLYPDVMHLPDFVWASTLTGLNPTPTWYGTGLETAVGIPLTAVALALLGWRERAVRAWILFGAAFALLCLGPRLRIAGEMTAVRLPYVAAQRLPGLDVMRTPGRFMFVGAIGFALAAGAGLAALARRQPSRTAALATAATALAALECWPRPWPQTALPPASPFYARLAADPAGGAVLDLPHGWTPQNDRASAYMYYQTIHRRPIAWAYLSRGYRTYPTPGLEALWRDDVPAGPGLRARLHELVYRYVIVHRYPLTFHGGWVEHGRDGRPVGPPHAPAEERVIAGAFAGQPPAYQDDLIAVWAVRP